MTHITKHHSEEEWERNDRKWYRVSLLISWNTIGVNDQLPRSRELILFKEGWLWNIMVFIEHHFCGSLVLKFISNLILVFIWCPEETDENVVLSLHHVQVLIESLFLGQEHFVNVNGGCFSLLLTIVII